MDQGIIRSFKVKYRKQLVRKLVDAIDGGSTLPKTNVLVSMRMTDYARRNVIQKTVENCFKKYGFKNGCEEEKEISEEESETIEKEAKETVDAANELLEINSQKWNAMKSGLNVNIYFHEFSHVGDSLTICGVLTDAEIVDRGVSEDEDAEEHTDARMRTKRRP
ncbi:hypothetical protein AVEN_68360-1 [Araneus ventricosus]|uniref:DDE-1 domain-containing protein n=1 Tax=Araneus ventricosus TaxID=182803 RepID=A0A4Y2G320_ARAVE|nr:hypothetical protein AVEN_68360-1 [Araneus ventricosus]